MKSSSSSLSKGKGTIARVRDGSGLANSTTGTISLASTNSISRGGSSGQHTGVSGSSYATSTNIWAKLLGDGSGSVWDGLDGREDVYDDPNDEQLDDTGDLISTKSRFEDEGICGTTPLKLCCLASWYETKHFFKTLGKHPVIIVVSLVVFALVCGLGMWAVESEREGYVRTQMETAKFVVSD